ncbi:DUF1194 domain-containing protein [Maricaulis sp. D1M11]|uniref:DUF1194 domain-containing protein n=1 Tax=Maricaulis sp. D1M11 TaxID=3076117 RepID=UPI0039B5C4E7
MRGSFITIITVFLVCLTAGHGPVLAQTLTPFARPDVAPRPVEDRSQVDLELVLAVDISYSVDEEEARRQRAGYVAALASEQVLRSIQSGLHGRIAVTYVEWADSGMQRTAADWSVIETEADALAFADQVANAPYVRGNYTAIGAAIVDSVARLDNNTYSAPRQVIDISGDGPQNQGVSLVEARARADAAGVVVNGLPVIQPDGASRYAAEMDLEGYFEREVMTGSDAFVLPARSEDEFRQAILRKLVLEIAGASPSPQELRPSPDSGFAP